MFVDSDIVKKRGGGHVHTSGRSSQEHNVYDKYITGKWGESKEYFEPPGSRQGGGCFMGPLRNSILSVYK